MTSLPDSLPRIGLGTDRHRLVPDRACWLGGVLFGDCPVGPDGHSDGDAVLHALTDALLGAAGLEDLGTLFPDTDPTWQGVASESFLQAAIERLAAIGLHCWSVDLVVQCDQPKIAPQRDNIRRHLADLLALPVDRVNLKGKTREGVDAEIKAVDVTAVVLIGPTV
ncbi:MAG: 2-C-methyl-D-erythritol 2,4-cyclodiphosphate synthase [Planctomycetes bacterium]|nr:2-C-methyl-D-erythritol 2,4-cyclodiphosphate synthase [Planctomycetota bacterium]